MVDAQIMADMMDIAYSHVPNTVVILMTGDADMVPALEKIFNKTTTNVEVYLTPSCIITCPFSSPRCKQQPTTRRISHPSW